MPTVNLYFVTILLALMMYLKSSFSQCSVSVFFPDFSDILSDAFAITITGISSGGSRPSVKGGPVIQTLRQGGTRSKKNNLDLRAPVWSKKKGGGRGGPFLDPPLIRNSIAGGSLHLSLCYFVSSYKRNIFYSAERSDSEKKVICLRFSLPSSPSIPQKRLQPKVIFYLSHLIFHSGMTFGLLTKLARQV